MTQQMYTIKEAASELGVEAHALRYWEEELEIAVERNPQGRRFYTEQNLQTFRDVMAWKEQGLSLKSIKEMLAGRRIILYRPRESAELEKAEKARRLQELLKQFISESIRESNEEFMQTMKEGLLKELDYQFRLQEEREMEREKVRIEMEDAHFKRLDENLRSAMEKRGRKKKKFFLGK